MVKVIDGHVEIEYADAPGKDPDLKRSAKMMTTCPACFEFFKSSNDFKYMGMNAEFSSGYAVRDVDNLPYRIYYCHMCDSVFAARVHFKRCPHKNQIIEYDTDQGQAHYVTCLEPGFKCDKCRNLPVHHWFCEILDRAPVIRFMDVYNDPWFNQMKRELLDEMMISDREAMKAWMTDKIISRR